MEDMHGDEDTTCQPCFPMYPKRNLKEEAMCTWHYMMHEPKNPHCHACLRAKLKRRRHARVAKGARRLRQLLGLNVTMDHITAKGLAEEGCMSTGKRAKDVLVIYDKGIQWLWAYPLASKSTLDTLNAIRHYEGDDYLSRVFSDRSPEIKDAMRHLPYISHRCSIP